MELVKDPGKCCGCRTCEYVCTQGAITMAEDDHGFLYPQINQNKCVNCGLCLKTCAFQSGYPRRKEYEPAFGYAARHKDRNIMMNSRSGGAFTALSDRILEKKGIIYGAGYDDREKFFKVVHKAAETPEQRDEFRGSKYVQSDLGDVFIRLKKNLEEGRWVLFSGTGCQVGALHKFLGKEYDRLITVDIVCHGVPSPRFWADFLKMREREEGGHITDVDFRDKKNFGWKAHRETVTVGKKEISSRLYTKVFYLDTAARPSCFECIYANRDRVGDITIADFWGHEQAVPGFGEDNRGVSLVMVNTSKGRGIWEKAREDMEVIECTGYPYRHTNMKHPTRRPDNYDEFWEDYLTRGFDYIMKKYCGYDVVTHNQRLKRDIIEKIKKPLRKVKRKIKRMRKKCK
ncbi:MAG: Coenzyme F420 hydrogenase/dehydrogenase, beta subunit C-terminal domain [Ruminococcus sp.]|jgi:coenzyme F420-reducing hydrogenase beta subunit